MKKVISILVIAVMLIAGVFVLTGCGDKETTTGGSSSSGTEQKTSGSSSSLFDIDDSKIVVTEGLGVDTSIIPKELKKALGNKEKYQVALQSPIAYTNTKARFSIYMKEVSKEDVETLVSYYETTFGVDGYIDDLGNCEMSLDWGSIDILFSESLGEITVHAGIK